LKKDWKQRNHGLTRSIQYLYGSTEEKHEKLDLNQAPEARVSHGRSECRISSKQRAIQINFCHRKLERNALYLL
jgi:hypothetical protein